MYKIVVICFLFPILNINSCSKVEVQTEDQSKIVGKWILKNKFLGDATDTPCGYATKQPRDITITISANTEEPTKKNYKFSGQSVVNQFFGYINLESFDEKLNINYMNISQLGSTKMAGPEDLMQCELGIYSMINEAKEFRIQDNMLLVGRFKKDNIPSRDSGTYLVFEAAK
jgi:heat shock protein HslJ